MILHRLLVTAAAGLMVCWLAEVAVAGPPDPVQTRSIEDSILIVQQTITRRLLERDQLRRILYALNQIDSTYRPYYAAWVVADRDLRERVRRVFRTSGHASPKDKDLVVVADPSSTELLEVSMGDRRMGRQEARQLLSDSVHALLLSGTYQRHALPEPPPPPRTDELSAPPQYMSLSASAFAVRIMASQGLGIEAVTGREEIGYHFWSTGDLSVRAIVGGLKLGVLLPFPYGYRTGEGLEPLSIKPSLLAGGTGFSGEYEHPLGPSAVGVRLAVGELSLGTWVSKFPDSLPGYSLHTTAQLYGTHTLAWEEHILKFTAGVGFHQVSHDVISQAAGKVVTLDKADFTSPLLRMEYTNAGARMFGGGVQWYSNIVYLNGWVEIVPRFLFLDVRYYAPVLRDPKPWEQRYFFMISPRLQVSY